MERFKKSGIGFLAALLICVCFELHADQMPYRNDLNADVKFWKKIFTEVSSNQYLIHDSQNLSIIYTIVTFPASTSERGRQRSIKAIKDKYERLLLQFHDNLKDTTDLQAWERRIYDTFRSIKEQDKFLHSSKRIRAQQGIREKFVQGLQNSFAYLPLMESIFDKYDLPRELIYMPHIESSFDINAASRAGAKGMWQFMWRTGRYFMKINQIADQRFDPIYSTEAAARLLKRNYDSLNDWALAITAYNHGLAGMKRAKRKFGGEYLKIREGYLRRSFGFASKNFYPEFLATVDIMDSLKHYFPGIEASPAFSFDEIIFQKSVNIRRLIKDLGMDLDELRRLNPSYKNAVWSGAITIHKGYPFRFPARANTLQALAYLDLSISASEKVAATENEKAYDSLIQISFSKPSVDPESEVPHSLTDFSSPISNRKSDYDLKLAASVPVSYSKAGVEVNNEIAAGNYPINLNRPEQTSQSKDDFAALTSRNNENTESGFVGSKVSYYISLTDVTGILTERLEVKNDKIVIFPNETLGHIAEWLNISAGYLRSLNDLHFGEKIYSGKALRLDFAYVTQEQFLKKRLKYHQEQIVSMLDGKTEIRLMNYTVNPGENLWNIARKRYNFPVNLLLYFNDLNKLEQLYPGDVIKLPII